MEFAVSSSEKLLRSIRSRVYVTHSRLCDRHDTRLMGFNSMGTRNAENTVVAAEAEPELDESFALHAERLRPSLEMYARRVSGRGVIEAQDVVQDAIAHVWLTRSRWKLGAGGWGPILRRIVHDRAVDVRRRAARDEVQLAVLVRLVDPRGADERAHGNELLHLVALAINELTPKQRCMCLGWLCNERTVRDIAAEISLAPKSVSNTLTKVRAHLRDRLTF